MPGCKTHDVIGVVTSIPLGVGGYLFLERSRADNPVELVTIFVASYYVGTFYLSPDLDMDSRVYKRWGALRVLWFPYKKMLRHRSKWSHSAIGGALRGVYFLLLIALFYLFADTFTRLFENTFLTTWWIKNSMHIWRLSLQNPVKSILICAAYFLGIMLASLVHVVTDKLWPFKQRPKGVKKP